MNPIEHLKHIQLRVAAAAVGAAMALAAPPAAAQAGGGWNTALQNLTTLGRTGAVAVTALAFMIGLVAVAYGGKLLWDKGGDRGDDISMGKVVFTILGGTLLMALSYFATQTVLTLGGTAGDIGAPAPVPR